MNSRFIHQGDKDTGWHKRNAGWMGKTCCELTLILVTHGITSLSFGAIPAAPMGSAAHKVETTGLNYADGL
jgi:hypothetical protein